MLEGVPNLTLAILNEATQAWVEYEYNRKIHSKIGEPPVAHFLKRPRGDATQSRQCGIAAPSLRFRPSRTAVTYGLLAWATQPKPWRLRVTAGRLDELRDVN